MIARLTDKNQLTIPESVISDFSDTEFFEVTCEDGRIVLTPVQLTGIERVWQKIEERGITEQDITDAVKWARGNK